jgi:light-regulated signal transduction histidine kinase (bacteriophytochrome)
VFAARDPQLRRVLYTCALFALMLSAAFGLLLQLTIERRQTHDERRTNLELESRVRERTAQLEKANVDLESFSDSVSHDLRAPLRAIDGQVHFLFEQHQAVLDASARRCIDNVQRNVRYMARLIDELLELARVGRIALKQETVDMSALVDEVLPAVLGTRGNVAVDVQALPSVCADAMLIRQIWFNLLDNAVKYSSHAALPQISIRAEARAGEVTYCVADNGVGFDMRHYEQLFKPFSRLNSSGEFSGTGVGLALVKRIVERHDGRVWAESIPNQSTKVFFSLPASS